MTLIVFDTGLRTTTPWYDVFPAKDVEQLEQLKAANRVETHEDRLSRAERKSSKTSIYEDIANSQQQHKPVYYAWEIMTFDVTTIDKDASINAAWQLFQTNQFRHIPVIDNGRLCGMISDRDILSHTSNIMAADHPAHLADPVKSIMTRRILTARPNTEIRLLAGALAGHRIGALPIVNEMDQLIGIVTCSDILKTLMHRVPIEIWG